MATEREDQAVKAAAKDLKDTPYELLYISKPTATTSKYAFHHATASTPTDAHAIIAEATETLRSGKAEWSDGTRYIHNDLQGRTT